MNQRKKAFTITELLVSVTILIILTTLGFYTYTENLVDARDSERTSDMAKISAALDLYKQKKWVLPNPWNSFNIQNNGTTVAKQWLLDENVLLSTLQNLPKDPYVDVSYRYSISANKQEYQVSATLENLDNPFALLQGSYKTVAKNVLPTITLAVSGTGNTEIAAGYGAGDTNRTKFVFDAGSHNLPYTFEDDYAAYTDGTSFTGILTDPTINFWQNSDYRSCTQIQEAGKSIGDGEYQIVNDSWVLTSSWCTF